MATTLIPKSMIKQITAIIRCFFWGKAQNTRYMAIGWQKITRPKGMRGLGFTDLSLVNETLLVKFLWRLASGSNALWVQVVKAKYLPKSELWLSKRDSKCTPFWKALMNLRGTILPWLTWRLGDGNTCGALAQPWFQGALDCPNQVNYPHDTKVSNLVINRSGEWDVDRLIALFSHVSTMFILSEVQPPRPGGGQDRLIFKPATNGFYSVKKAYVLLSNASQQPTVGSKQMWKAIWEKGNVPPRVRVFMWKLVHEGLPLACTMNRRFPSISTMCTICGEGDEDARHLTHGCQLSRSCHFTGPLALKTDLLPFPFTQALVQLDSKMDDAQWIIYANSL